MRTIRKYWLLISFLLVSFLVCLASCTKFSRNNEGKTGNPAPNDMAKFASQMRPAKGKADSLCLLGTYYQKRGALKHAVAEFRKALQADPCSIQAYEGLGLAFGQAGEFRKSAEAYSNAVKLNPNLGYLQNNLGYSLIRLQKYSEAIAALKGAQNLEPGNKRIHNNLGLAYGLSGQYDLALAEFEKAGEKAVAHLTLGSLLFKAGRQEEAGTHYRIALKIDPSLAEARKGLKDCGQFSKNEEVEGAGSNYGALQNSKSVPADLALQKLQPASSAKRKTIIIPELQLETLLSRMAEKGYFEAGSVQDGKHKQG